MWRLAPGAWRLAPGFVVEIDAHVCVYCQERQWSDKQNDEKIFNSLEYQDTQCEPTMQTMPMCESKPSLTIISSLADSMKSPTKPERPNKARGVLKSAQLCRSSVTLLESPGASLIFSSAPTNFPSAPFAQPSAPLESPGTLVETSGKPLESPSASLNYSGVPLKSPDASLSYSGVPLESPDASLSYSGVPLKSPGTLVETSGVSLESPGTLIETLGKPLESPDALLESPSAPLIFPSAPTNFSTTPFAQASAPFESPDASLKSPDLARSTFTSPRFRRQVHYVTPRSASPSLQSAKQEVPKERKRKRACGSFGCTFTDYHLGPHSYEMHTGVLRRLHKNEKHLSNRTQEKATPRCIIKPSANLTPFPSSNSSKPTSAQSETLTEPWHQKNNLIVPIGAVANEDCREASATDLAYMQASGLTPLVPVPTDAIPSFHGEKALPVAADVVVRHEAVASHGPFAVGESPSDTLEEFETLLIADGKNTGAKKDGTAKKYKSYMNLLFESNIFNCRSDFFRGGARAKAHKFFSLHAEKKAALDASNKTKAKKLLSNYKNGFDKFVCLATFGASHAYVQVPMPMPSINTASTQRSSNDVSELAENFELKDHIDAYLENLGLGDSIDELACHLNLTYDAPLAPLPPQAAVSAPQCVERIFADAGILSMDNNDPGISDSDNMIDLIDTLY